jgi:hypothetical protein
VLVAALKDPRVAGVGAGSHGTGHDVGGVEATRGRRAVPGDGDLDVRDLVRGTVERLEERLPTRDDRRRREVLGRAIIERDLRRERRRHGRPVVGVSGAADREHDVVDSALVRGVRERRCLGGHECRTVASGCDGVGRTGGRSSHRDL